MMKKILNRTVNTDFKHIISLDVLRNRAFYTTNREKDVKFNFTKFYSNADLLKWGSKYLMKTEINLVYTCERIITVKNSI